MRLPKCLLILSLLTAGISHAATYKVSSSLSTGRIQAVIDATSPGDTVFFSPGIYRITAAVTLKCAYCIPGQPFA